MPGENSKYFELGEETTWATAVAGTRSFEIRNDDFAVVPAPERVGETTRYQQQGELAHNVTQVLEKVTGSVDMAFYRVGCELMLKNLLGGASTPAAVAGSTNARHGRTYTTTSDGDLTSLTGRVGRVRRTGDLETYESEVFTYAGLVISGFTIDVSAGNPWAFKPTFIGATETPGGAATSQTYPSLTDAGFFPASATSISVGGTTLDEFNGFSLTGDFKMLEHPSLNAAQNILKPVRQGVPAITGQLSGGLYSSDVATALYDRFRSGEKVEIIAECKVRPAGYTTNPPDDHSLDILRVTLGECFLTGSTPSGPPGSATMIEVGFDVLWDGSGSMVEIYLQNSATTDN